MTSETKTCQNCKAQFTIEPEDFDFYKKIDVPPPTFCPLCRRQRRMAWINFTHLHRRPCGLCGKESISKYPPEAPLVTYCPKCWYSDNWDPFSYGRDYDFSRTFFDQIQELLRTVPIPTLDIDPIAGETSPFTNHAGNIKNCYLAFFAIYSEDCMYGFCLEGSRSLVDFSMATKSDFCYDSDNIFKDNKCIGVKDVTESLNCFFLKDSANCQNCFASANLRNKKYYAWNKACTKEEYEQEVKKWDLGSYRVYQELKTKAAEHWKKYPPKPYFDDLSVGCTGNYIFESKNSKECYEVSDAEDSKYLMMMIRGPVRDSYDVTGWGDNIARSYEGYFGTNVSGVRFCMETNMGDLQEGEYSILASEANIFGCVSTKNARHCILNKRYPEAEYKELRAKIIKQMNDMPYTDKVGRVYRYGEFFPIEMSWSAYNETLAQVFFPLTKKQALAESYPWQDPNTTTHAANLRSTDLPDHIKDATDVILRQTIACETCPRAYRIIQNELQFLRAMNLPLPRRCPLCRIDERIEKWALQMTLVERTCDKCAAVFRTAYTTAAAPYILCKACYNAEVV